MQIAKPIGIPAGSGPSQKAQVNMKFKIALLKLHLKLLAVIVMLGAASAARAGLAVPYTPNADTLHLWHLNETNSPFAIDSATLNTNAFPITLTNIGEPTPATYPFTNSSLGNPGPGFPGLAYAYSGNNKYHLLFGGSYPDVTGLRNPTTGAFTFEALVCLSNSISGDYEIFTGDNGGGIGSRGWQWRFNTSQEQWDLLGGSTDNNFTPGLPTTGPDAAKVNTWYHVAVTFTGQSPTNGDPASELTLYWTLLDPSRTHADVLVVETNVFNTAMPNGIRPLDGSPEGAVAPNIAIGGSGRNTTSNPGNNEGLVGSICEVRVTDLCLKSNEMAFVAGGSIPPTNTAPLPASILVGYGQPLNVTASVEASQPATYSWYQNGTNLISQTNATLAISSATFGNNGSYYLVTANSYGAATTSVMQVTIGAMASELYGTGIVSNEVSSGDVPDPHYALIQSSNPSFLGPTEMIWESNCPIEIICVSGSYAPNVGASMWISDQGNQGGSASGDPAGNYTIRTQFVLDQASPTNLFFQSGFELDGVLTNILLNGLSTGFSLPSVAALYANAFTLSNDNGVVTFHGTGTTFDPVTMTATNSGFFVPGLNTMDFVIAPAGTAAIKVDAPTMVGYALPPGPPTILQQPASVTVRDANLTEPGSSAAFSVVALGRPPLTYQWYSDGSVLAGATNRTLSYPNPAVGHQGSSFQVVVSNDSGSITSSVARLTLVGTNQFPIAPNYTNDISENQTTTFDLSTLFHQAIFPDNDPGTISAFDSVTTNGVVFNDLTETLLGYTPTTNYVGWDSWTYTVTDAVGDTATGTNYIRITAQTAPIAITAQIGAGGIQMSGSGGPAGGSYSILGSPTLGAPVSTWKVVATGTFDSGGGFSVTLPTTDAAGFYVLETP